MSAFRSDTIALADSHGGHRAGIVPPGWQWKDTKHAPEWKRKWARIQRELWDSYLELIDLLAPCRRLLLVGDLIEGRGYRSGGVELVAMDPMEQVEIAVAALRMWKAEKVLIFRGTPYHTGENEDYEDLIAKELGAQIENHACVDIDGKVFDVRHHVGRSSIPHGRLTAPSREYLDAVLRAARQEAPLADVVLRAHCHYFAHGGGVDWLTMVLPCLQAKGSKYGEKIAGGHVDWGVVQFDCSGKGVPAWLAHVRRLKANRMKIVKL